MRCKDCGQPMMMVGYDLICGCRLLTPAFRMARTRFRHGQAEFSPLGEQERGYGMDEDRGTPEEQADEEFQEFLLLLLRVMIQRAGGRVAISIGEVEQYSGYDLGFKGDEEEGIIEIQLTKREENPDGES